MKVIKLDAIDSTNDFLKGLSNQQDLDNFTIVSAESQSKGKGQMGSVWTSESSKNLIMSILVKECLVNINQLFTLNILVSLAVIDVLQSLDIPHLSIKWPNDIMSYNKKIGGILIENSIKSDGTINSIVGLGLNVNQVDFENLPKASSLAVICQSFFDKEELLLSIGKSIQNFCEELKFDTAHFWSKYTDALYKKGIPMPFVSMLDVKFMGIIQGVSSAGKLQILLEDDSVAEYDIKEVQMLY